MKRLIVCLIVLFASTVLAEMVSVSVPPQKYIVDKITGGNVLVNIMVDKSSDPHTFSPKASQVALLERSTIYLAIGFPFEETTLERVIDRAKIKATDAGIEKLAGHEHDDGHDDHDVHDDHGEHDDHDEHGDPHIWTSPQLMKKIAENTCNALVEAFPSNATTYKSNYDKFITELDDMDSRFKTLFADDNIVKTFMVYHPSHSYFARDYGLTQLEVEQDGKAPKPAQLKELIDTVRKAGVRLFIVQPRQSPDAAKVIVNELKIPFVAIDILDEDWNASMQALYEAFKTTE